MKKICMIGLAIFFLPGVGTAQLGKFLRHKAGEGAKQGAQAVTEKSIDKVLAGKQKDKNADTNVNTKQGKTIAGSASSINFSLPEIINFDWEVKQRMRNEEEGGYKTPGYYFTANGDYAAIIPPPEEEKSFTMMIYTKEGRTLIVDDKKKTITIMSMPKAIGEGAAMGKEVAEHIKKSPLEKDTKDELTITKTGKTKKILGYTAEEYLVKSNEVQTTQTTDKTGTASFWYAKVPFDPIRIYNMGAGRPADVSKIKNDPKMKNNIFSVPLLNKNFLQVEVESGGIKGIETLEIKNVFHTFRTAGYTVKDMSKKNLKEIIVEENN
jgi:hypothetical protein